MGKPIWGNDNSWDYGDDTTALRRARNDFIKRQEYYYDKLEKEKEWKKKLVDKKLNNDDEEYTIPACYIQCTQWQFSIQPFAPTILTLMVGNILSIYLGKTW